MVLVTIVLLHSLTMSGNVTTEGVILDSVICNLVSRNFGLGTPHKNRSSSKLSLSSSIDRIILLEILPCFQNLMLCCVRVLKTPFQRTHDLSQEPSSVFFFLKPKGANVVSHTLTASWVLYLQKLDRNKRLGTFPLRSFENRCCFWSRLMHSAKPKDRSKPSFVIVTLPNSSAVDVAVFTIRISESYVSYFPELFLLSFQTPDLQCFF